MNSVDGEYVKLQEISSAYGRTSPDGAYSPDYTKCEFQTPEKINQNQNSILYFAKEILQRTNNTLNPKK